MQQSNLTNILEDVKKKIVLTDKEKVNKKLMFKKELDENDYNVFFEILFDVFGEDYSEKDFMKLVNEPHVRDGYKEERETMLKLVGKQHFICFFGDSECMAYDIYPPIYFPQVQKIIKKNKKIDEIIDRENAKIYEKYIIGNFIIVALREKFSNKIGYSTFAVAKK